MPDGYELAIVITGQQTAVAPVQATDRALAGLETRAATTGRAFDRATGPVRALASQGLSEIVATSPQAVAALANVAIASAGVSAALGPIAVGIAVAVAAWQLHEYILGRNVEALKKVQEEEQRYLAGRAVLQGSAIANDQRALQAETAMRATQRRSAGDVLGAIEELRAGKLRDLAIDKEREAADIRRQAREAKADPTRALDALERRVAATRELIDAEAIAEDTAERNRQAEAARQIQLESERGLADAVNARRQAQLTAAVEALQAEGRLAEAVALGTKQRLEAIRFEAEQRRAAIAERIKDERAAEQARLELGQETSAKIVQTLQQEAQQRRQLVAEAAAAGQRQGLGTTAFEGLAAVDALKRRDRQVLAQGFANARASGVPERDLVFEQQRVQEQLAGRVRQLREQFAAFPAVLEAIQREVADIEWGGFITDVTNADASLAALATQGRGAGDALGDVGGRARGTVEVFRDDLPNSIGTTIAYVDALTNRLVVLTQWFGVAERAAERFADAE